MISPDTIQNIMEASKVEEVIGDFVSLKKRGVNLLGLCPFHNEKTPSFTVSPSKGIYKCFGCGKNGRSIDFIMDHEHYSYPEALRYLAKKYQIEIEEEIPSAEAIQQKNELESLYAVNTFAQNYFSDQLFNSEEGKNIGLSYYKERGFSVEIIKKFQLGYSLKGWNNFTNFAVKQGYKSEYLVKLGLASQKEDKFFDRFESRVMFPIHNLSGRVIGFGGRTLSTEKTTAKYVNSPESDIYHKSHTLYGIYFAKNAIASNNLCYLVEGYTDVISLFQTGIENVVASSGTSLTTDQIKLIKRFTPNICVLYDGDNAGIKASFRGIDMILEEGLNVEVVSLPEGEDPDSYCRKYRSSEVIEYIKTHTSDFIRFKLNLLLPEIKDDPIKRAELIKDIVSSIAKIPDAINRSVFITSCSTLLNISEQVLTTEVAKIRNKNISKNLNIQEEISENATVFANKQIETSNYYDLQHLEKEIIRIMLQYGEETISINSFDEDNYPIEEKIPVAKFMVDELSKDLISMSKASYQKILLEYEKQINDGFIPNEKYFINFDDDEIRKTTIDIINTPYTLSENWVNMHKIEVKDEKIQLESTVSSALYALKLRITEELLEDEQKQLIDNYESEGYTVKLLNMKALMELKSKISNVLGRIVLR